MHFRSATKVGLAVLVSIGAFMLIWYFVLGQGLRSHSYPIDFLFKDAQNITTGAAVRMAGVDIGEVDDIGLTTGNLAKLHLLINKRYSIPIGSEIIVTSGGLIGEKYVSIQPPSGVPKSFLAPNSTVHGQDTIQLEDLMAKASAIATSSNQVIREAQLALVDTRHAIQSVSKLASDPALTRAVHETLANVESASRNVENASRHADLTAAQVQSMTSGAQPRIQKMMASMQKSADNVQDLTNALSSILSGEDIKSDLGATLHNVKMASEQLTTIANNLAKLTGDTQMTAEIKESVGNVATATAQTREAATAINQTVQRLTSRFRRPRSPGQGAPGGAGARGRNPGVQGSLDLVQNIDPGRFRADVTALAPIGSSKFVYGGLHGLGEANQVTLQLGQGSGEHWDSRFGIYAGRLGAGADYDLRRNNGWSVDLYDPNHLTADLYGRRRLNDDTSLIFGVENLLRHPTPTIGVRIKH